MKFFCKTEHFDKNAKHWRPGATLDASEGDKSIEWAYFTKELPKHIEPYKAEPVAMSQMVEHVPVDFITAMKMTKPKAVPLPEPELVGATAVPVAVKAMKPEKRGK